MTFSNNSNLSNNILFLLLGIILLVVPGVSIDLVVYAVGFSKLFSGAMGLYRQSKFEQHGNFQFNSNVFNLFFGISLLIIPSFSNMLISIVPIVFGIWITSSGINQITNALRYRQVNNKWWVNLIIGILCAWLGLFVIFNPIAVVKDIIRIIGIFFLAKGAFGIYNRIKEGKNENPNVID